MSTPLEDLLNAAGGRYPGCISLYGALRLVGERGVVDAADRGLVHIVCDGLGTTHARQTIERSSEASQREDITVQITDAGRDHLAGAR